MLSLIKSRVMIIDVLKNCKMMILPQVFSIKTPNILLHASRRQKRKEKESKTKGQKRKNEKIGMNRNEKGKIFARLLSLTFYIFSRAITSFTRTYDCPASIDWFTATSHTRRVVIKIVLRKMARNQQFEPNDRRRNINRSIKLIP